jgi:hypothetical protein
MFTKWSSSLGAMTTKGVACVANSVAAGGMTIADVMVAPRPSLAAPNPEKSPMDEDEEVVVAVAVLLKV